jgi:hypothetical protein
MNIDDLKKSISQMSEEELKKSILDLRQSRRMPTVAQRAQQAVANGETPKKKKGKVTRGEISDMLRSLSQEDLAALMSRMGGAK